MRKAAAQHPLTARVIALREAVGAALGDPTSADTCALAAVAEAIHPPSQASVSLARVGPELALWSVLYPVGEAVPVVAEVLERALAEPRIEPQVEVLACALAWRAYGDASLSRSLLRRVVERFTALAADRDDEQARSQRLSIANLVWSAIDDGLVTENAARRLVEAEPDLLRAPDNLVVHAGTLLGAVIAPNGPAMHLLTTFALERLADFDPRARGQHEWSGPFKTCACWPGAEVFLATLDKLERQSHLARGEFDDAPTSSLWHVLHHSRRLEDHDAAAARNATPDRQLTAALAERSERVLLWAAVVAPWWGPEIAAALGAEALPELVLWHYAHDGPWRDPSAAGSEHPRRLEDWVALATQERAGSDASARASGRVDLPWLLKASEALGVKRAVRVIKLFPLASRARSVPTEALALAALGQGRAKVTQGAKRRQQAAIKAYGLLPLAAQETPATRARWFATLLSETERSASTRSTPERGAEAVGLTNLAASTGHGSSFDLQWRTGTLPPSPQVPAEPQEAGAYRLLPRLDRSGHWELAVINTARGTTLKNVPRGIGAEALRETLQDANRRTDEFLARLRPELQRLMTGAIPVEPHDLVALLSRPDLAARRYAIVTLAGKEKVRVWVADQKGPHLLDRTGTDQRLPKAPVRLAHPAAFASQETVRVWRRFIARSTARGLLRPLIDQLFRFSKPLRVARATPNRALRLASTAVDGPRWLATLRARGWRTDGLEYPSRAVRADGARLWVTLDEPHTALENRPVLHPHELWCRELGGKDVPLASLSRTVLAEVWSDLEAARLAAALVPADRFSEAYAAKIAGLLDAVGRTQSWWPVVRSSRRFWSVGEGAERRLVEKVSGAVRAVDGTPVEIPQPEPDPTADVVWPMREPPAAAVRQLRVLCWLVHNLKA